MEDIVSRALTPDGWTVVRSRLPKLAAVGMPSAPPADPAAARAALRAALRLRVRLIAPRRKLEMRRRMDAPIVSAADELLTSPANGRKRWRDRLPRDVKARTPLPRDAASDAEHRMEYANVMEALWLATLPFSDRSSVPARPLERVTPAGDLMQKDPAPSYRKDASRPDGYRLEPQIKTTSRGIVSDGEDGTSGSWDTTWSDGVLPPVPRKKPEDRTLRWYVLAEHEGELHEQFAEAGGVITDATVVSTEQLADKKLDGNWRQLLAGHISVEKGKVLAGASFNPTVFHARVEKLFRRAGLALPDWISRHVLAFAVFRVSLDSGAHWQLGPRELSMFFLSKQHFADRVRQSAKDWLAKEKFQSDAAAHWRAMVALRLADDVVGIERTDADRMKLIPKADRPLVFPWLAEREEREHARHHDGVVRLAGSVKINRKRRGWYVWDPAPGDARKKDRAENMPNRREMPDCPRARTGSNGAESEPLFFGADHEANATTL